jgi:DMSO/TMAO reductase YedYZ heme-binding membrane subunit
MVFVVSLIAAALFVLLLRKPLQKVPFVFYIIALILVGYYVYSYFNGTHVLVWRYCLVALQRCTLSLAFLTIVMYIGVLPESSKLRGALAPVRRQLSILGCILAFGHIIVYISAYIVRFSSGFTAMSSNMVAALSVAVLLVLLLAVLLVTSFTQVRKLMQLTTWKKIQRFSYLFYFLIYAHILFVMMPSVLAGSATITTNVVVYSVVFAAYTVLRVVGCPRSKTFVEAHKAA